VAGITDMYHHAWPEESPEEILFTKLLDVQSNS
jgi:hypothetical protein